MLKLGEVQKLMVVKRVDFGVYLAESRDAGEKDRVLLPIKQVPEGTEAGDTLEVFLYRDSMDRMIATVREPALVIGGLTRLQVKQVGKIGAFLDWGLEKDLLLPYAEQTYRVQVGDAVLVTLYIDKSSRLCATMNVYEALESGAPYGKGDSVSGTLYLISENFGGFVAVDDRYSALIPHKEMYGGAAGMKVGERVTARVVRVLEDGRLELAVRDKGYVQRNSDAETILALMEEKGGSLPFTDKASPAVILEATGMSKAQFKRAVGKLLKEGRVRIGEASIDKV